MAISRDLTQKLKKDDDSDEDDGEQDRPMYLTSSDKENPWMTAAKTETEVEEFISGYRKYWDEQHRKENKQDKASESNTSTNEGDKTQNGFEESEMKDLPESMNPVEEVIEEYLPGQNGFSVHNKSDESESEGKKKQKIDKKQKKKLQKTSKDKLGIKSPKSKITKSKAKAGTSSWSILPVNETIAPAEDNSNGVKDIDIDEMFDSVDDKLQDKINAKLAKVKRMLDQETKNENKKARRKRNKKKDDSVSDVDKLGLKGQRNMKPMIDKPIEESTDSRPSSIQNSRSEKVINVTNVTDRTAASKPKAAEIDPNKFMNMKPKHIKTLLPDEIAGEEDALDDSETEEDQHRIISEAFADDDVVDEFRKEKEDEVTD